MRRRKENFRVWNCRRVSKREMKAKDRKKGTLVITSTATSRVERLTSGSGSFGRRTTLSSTSYMRHPETQSTTTTPENGYPSSGVGRSRQPDAHSRTMSTPRTRKPSASAADGEDASSETPTQAGSRFNMSTRVICKTVTP